MSAASTESRQPPAPPRGVALSGIIFSVLYIISLVLVRLAVPADPTDPVSGWQTQSFRNWVRIALNLVPFTGIAFLWFMAVLRNRIGLLEDRFFATVFLGSGLAVRRHAVRRRLRDGGPAGYFRCRPSRPERNLSTAGRGMAYALMNTFGMRMAAVFMFVTSTIGLRTAVLARWVSFVGFACGVVLLLVITELRLDRTALPFVGSANEYVYPALRLPAGFPYGARFEMLPPIEGDDGNEPVQARIEQSL